MLSNELLHCSSYLRPMTEQEVATLFDRSENCGWNAIDDFLRAREGTPQIILCMENSNWDPNVSNVGRIVHVRIGLHDVVDYSL
jgi:hypothetical protein